MRCINLDRCAVIPPGAACAYSASTGAPIANTINRHGPRLVHTRPRIPPRLDLTPAQIAALPLLPEALYLAWPYWGRAHWGHFLIEEAAVLWAFLGAHRRTGVRTVIVPAYARDGIEPVREALEQHHELLFSSDLAAPLLVERLWSPVPSMHEGDLVDPTHFDNVIEVLRALIPGLPPPHSANWLDPSLPQRIWLSRSSLPSHYRRVEAEADLEAALERRGWTILHPEALSTSAQLRHLINARHIAGTIGSAFHTLMFLGRDTPLTAEKQVRILSAPQLSFPERTLRAQLEGQALPHQFLHALEPLEAAAESSAPPHRWPYRFATPIEAILEWLEDD
ncbi:glycosyltransferase family 61 protein [Synechococcus sp. BSF8S]|uniref:glycosyltransferase 61 family protein n=1 Tax=Synechococcales TaxID=1890424 RepID=UPI00162691F7|nr:MULTISPECIES: glycosyltransferase family 61 protein [unclassified Synechococcus]MBC1261810.1 glycosyltransferase family 61 protein [Synechococcus sp. BSF8S]MBC1264739.1 glycosyltransferase family 61 protein [Synechococcus sp. BSA11S]